MSNKLEKLKNKLINVLIQDYGFLFQYLEKNTKLTNYETYLRMDFLSKNNDSFIVGFISDTLNISDLTIEIEKSQNCHFFFNYNGELRSYIRNEKNNQLNNYSGFVNYKTEYNSIDSKVIPLDSSLENIFYDAHSLIRDIDGLHPDEALDEICKLIYTKLFDEENHNNKFFTTANCCCDPDVSTTIRKLYKEANEYDNRVFSLRIPGYKRSRGVFDNPISLSIPAIVAITKLFSKFNFTTSSTDVKGRAFQKFMLPAQRAGMGQYFTPSQVVDFIVKIVKPKLTDLILDPFCGSGHFLTSSLRHVKQLGENKSEQKLFDEFAHYKLHGIEKSERMVRIAMTDMRLNGDGHSNIRCTDALLPFESYNDLNESSFDIVMTNPPFGSVLTNEAQNYIGKFELQSQTSKIALEIVGLERCIQFLRENGKLAIVLPDSIFVNPSLEKVRNWITTKVDVCAVISLPIETFSPFGANIKTSILFAKKTSNVIQGEVFMGELENIGYDSSGRSSDSNDIPMVEDELLSFLNKRGW